MAFVTFVFFQAFNLLNVRHDTRSALSRETLENQSAFAATAAVVGLLVLLVEMDVLHGLFATTDLTSGQWLALANGDLGLQGNPDEGEPPVIPGSYLNGLLYGERVDVSLGKPVVRAVVSLKPLLPTPQ